MSQSIIFVAIGSNLAGRGGEAPLQTCRWAVERLAGWPGLSLEACSRWYRSAPVPPSGQPDYVNGAIRMSGTLSPEAVLAVLHAVEAEAGRERSVANAARRLDLDLLGVGAEMRAGPGLVLPHPRLHERGFVLLPLAEVAGDWMHPVLQRSVQALAAGCDRAGVAMLDEGEGAESLADPAPSA